LNVLKWFYLDNNAAPLIIIYLASVSGFGGAYAAPAVFIPMGLAITACDRRPVVQPPRAAC
jgi:hypothetical protein